MRTTKDKKGDSIREAFRDILSEGRKPTRIRTDKGQEFRSKAVNALFKDQNIEHLYAQNTEIKANYAERVIKTIKTKIYRYMTFKQSNQYVDRLQDFVRNYNSFYHRTIGMAPDKVTESKETNLWWKMYWPKSISIKRKTVRKPYKLKVGDNVRVSRIRNPFTREYDQKWSRELFIISDRWDSRIQTQ
ncbi:hypothetical protein FSP39_021059 [Pinctada imbricata]|uniref:Integrase catalytic domain-containing protein n=1 Tax=Pinctada imbricata TaxID=66713 RepID=A0AA88YJ32_PINIB|nr:hypothetical protein FSP39_021059 [Pinctada imbricata]